MASRVEKIINRFLRTHEFGSRSDDFERQINHFDTMFSNYAVKL